MWHGTSNHSSSSSQISYYVHEVFIVQLLLPNWQLWLERKERSVPASVQSTLYWTFVIFEKCTWQILNFCWLYGLQQTDLDPHQIDQNPSCWVLGWLVFNRLNCRYYSGCPKKFLTLFWETFSYDFWNIFWNTWITIGPFLHFLWTTFYHFWIIYWLFLDYFWTTFRPFLDYF